jgi:predicted metal-dependent phosphoesterase TrpH
MFADLHLHSRFSDGTFTPEEVVARGRRAGFSALSLTDHDTVEGCARMAAACHDAGIEFITGSELTVEHKDTELHILGYFLDIRNEKLLTELGRFQAIRQNRIREMVARLNELHVPLDADEVFALADCRSPGRPHIARALVQAGHCASHDEAFQQFLKKGRPAWVPKAKMSAFEGIELIHQAGGLAVMAHDSRPRHSGSRRTRMLSHQTFQSPCAALP